MAFQISPGVNVSEIDLTTVIPAVSTTEGAIAGVFRWGPAEQPVLVSSVDELARRYGKPTDNNFETFMVAESFLGYGNTLFVSRAIDANTFNAVASASAVANTQIKNGDAYATATIPAGVRFVAKYPGAIGNSLRVSVCENATAFSRVVGAVADANNSVEFSFPNGTQSATLTVTNSQGAAGNTAASDEAVDILASISIGDKILVGNSSIGQQYVKVTSKSVPVIVANGEVSATIGLASRVSLAGSFDASTVVANWEFFDAVNFAPGTSSSAAAAGGTGDEMHVVVVDEGGAFTGRRGAILEVFEAVSRASDARGEQGGSVFYRNVINDGSQYIWVGQASSTGPVATSETVTTSSATAPESFRMAQGTDSASESLISLASVIAAYNVFRNAEQIDVSLILAGKARGATIANYLIDNIAEYRKDCVVFVSPEREDVVGVPDQELGNVVGFRNQLRSTSYAFLDSGYKYMYDRYNDVFRWVPLNGDIAGLAVRTDSVRDPWFSFAGFQRGTIKNASKLAWNPDLARRDVLYKNSVNPVVSVPGSGILLYGDKTLLARPSAFDRINVRRLFIVLEKAIARAAQSSLFEFNDEFTRAQFRNLVEPYLRDVQGRRGIVEFRVVADETNNTGEVIDRNEFVGDIYIKPARSINFIQLNFVAVRTNVDFNEVVGA